jgi:hypothetical protein
MNDKVKEDEMGRECSKNGEETPCRILVRKPEGRRPLGRPRRCGWRILKLIFER